MVAAVRLHGLYAITDEALEERLISAVADALEAGVRILQYRDKGDDVARRGMEALMLRALTRRHDALLIINDDPELAVAVQADGAHLGRDDPDIAEVRRLLGPEAAIGVSCYDSLELARDAAAAGADYVAFGSVYPSTTKPGAVRAPLELLTAAKQELGIPVCAIGGITPANAGPVLAAGADMLAVVSSIFSAPDIQQAVRAFLFPGEAR
jgi:thiamine-phosphate pyrophosphorylase